MPGSKYLVKPRRHSALLKRTKSALTLPSLVSSAVVSDMEHLPLELFDSIFINITDTKDLLQIRAVNKLYHAIFTPKAFQKIAFESGPNGCKRFNDIASSCFAGWVQDLSFEICLQNECGQYYLHKYKFVLLN